MAVSKLKSLILWGHPLGYEIVLDWQLPETLPDNFQIIIFRKLEAITDQDIIDHFAGSTPDDVTVFELEGSTDPLSPYGLNDFDVVKGTTYYYRAVVYDVTGNDYSETQDANGAPATSIETTSVDAKQAVINAVKRLYTAYGLKEKAHYTLHRAYSNEEQKPLTTTVTRTSGQELHQYLGRIARNSELGQLVSQGHLDLDIIQVIFEDPSDKQRDAVMMMYREGKEALLRYLMNPLGGALAYVDISIEGDVINQAVKDRIQVAGMVVFQCGVETVQKFTENMASWYEGEGIPVIE